MFSSYNIKNYKNSVTAARRLYTKEATNEYRLLTHDKYLLKLLILNKQFIISVLKRYLENLL